MCGSGRAVGRGQPLKEYQNQEGPKNKVSSTRRSTCVCGKFTHRLIWGSLSGQRTLKKSLRDSYMCQHIDLPTNYANRSRCRQQRAGASRAMCTLRVSPPRSMTSRWYREFGHGGNLHHGNQQIGCKSGLLFYRADLSAHQGPGVPLRSCRW